MLLIFILTVQLATIISSQILRKGLDTNVHNYKSSDFSTLVSTKYFVDKSLLIREIFHDSSAIVVTAPRRFGKSVNVDMIRRFLEIEVDDQGNKNVNKSCTHNYKFFVNLKIYQNHRQFFYQNFGNYPVIHIDYFPLTLISSFDDLLETFLQIIFETYNKHSYLLKAKKFWDSDLGSGFRDYLTGTRSQKFLLKADVSNAFVDLAHVLYRLFNKPVVVLIEDYDAYFDNMIFQINDNIDKCIKFIRSVNSDLIEAIGGNVSRIFITGSMRVTGPGVFLPEKVVEYYPFLRNHKYCQYYGFTTEEVTDLLKKHTADNETAIKKLESHIKTLYSGYKILGDGTEMYNMRSVLRYLVTGKHSPTRDLKNLINFFYYSQFRLEVVKLLQNRTLGIYVYNKLSQDDIVALRSFHDYSFSALPSHFLDLSLYLLLEFGFLTINSQITKDVVSVQIPNVEIETEFVDVLRLAIINQFEMSVNDFDYVTPVIKVINSFSERRSGDGMFRKLFENLKLMFDRSTYKSELEQDFHCFLFTIFRWKFRHVYINVCESTRNGSIDVLVKNNHNVTFIIETKVISDESTDGLEKCAQTAIDKIIENGYIGFIDATLRKKVVYLGICFSTVNRKIRLRYSKLLKEGDNLNKTSSVS